MNAKTIGLFSFVLGGIIAFFFVFDVKISTKPWIAVEKEKYIQSKLLPEKGVVLPAVWGNLGRRLIETGVIDKQKFEGLYSSRSGLNDEGKKLLYGDGNGNLTITSENANLLLNLFWAFGLGNKNEILTTGPMMDSRYGGAGQFASTGGWTLANGNTMEHYAMHDFVNLTEEQQNRVADMAKNIYRPCCNNPTHFPDCNHGMAMLGLLELMTSQGSSEEEMYQAALAVNSFWFPENYSVMVKYLSQKGIDFSKTTPKELLGKNFSSGSGYAQIESAVSGPASNGASCGV